MNPKNRKEMNNLLRNYRPMLMAFIGMLLLVSCNKDAIETENSVSVETAPMNVEPLDNDFTTKYFMGGEVQVRSEDDGTYSLAGSDTRLFEDQLSDTADAYNPNPVPEGGSTGLAIAGGVRKWSNNTVVYRIDGLSSQVRSELQKSFNEWSSKTNIRFKERTNESTYVTISSSGSNSNSGVATLGSYGSRGYIRLGTRATAVVIIHEIGHTLGYIHEQNRSDRDDYLIINYDNIENNAQDQFYKSSSANLITRDLDAGSTMMYGSYTFSKNGRPTITDRNGNVFPRRQARISSGDIAGTNAVYPGNNAGGDDDDDGGDDNDACSDVKDWSRNTRYNVGDRVIYRGDLYERDFTRWNFIKNCG